MTHKRCENTSTVTRERAADMWVVDIDGNKTRALSWCKALRVFLPLGEFYMKDKTKRKHANDVEPICAVAWDERVKRQKLRDDKRRKRLEIARKCDKNRATLFDFERN